MRLGLDALIGLRGVLLDLVESAPPEVDREPALRWVEEVEASIGAIQKRILTEAVEARYGG
jgi:hypothetical protein